MLIRPFSDLHVEFWNPTEISCVLDLVVPVLPTDKETVAVIAGDVGLAHRPETWAGVLQRLSKRFFAVVYVEGNHFFYRNDFFGRIPELKVKLPLPTNVHFLENGSVEIYDTLFVGATLWTDFLGKDIFKMQYARKSMNDFVLIQKADGSRLMPQDTVDLFVESKRYIFDALRSADGRKTVVVTHHGVSPMSVHERFRGDSLNCAFMTDLSKEIMEGGPDIWVHGHTHNSFDYEIGKTRVLVNPYGYRDSEVNPQHNKSLVVDV